MNIDVSNAHCGPRILFPDHVWLRVVSALHDCSVPASAAPFASRQRGGQQQRPGTRSEIGSSPVRRVRARRWASPGNTRAARAVSERLRSARSLSDNLRLPWPSSCPRQQRSLRRLARPEDPSDRAIPRASRTAPSHKHIIRTTSEQARLPAEFKHITKRRKRN